MSVFTADTGGNISLQDALLNIADCIEASLSLDELLPRILKCFRRSVGAEAGSLFLTGSFGSPEENSLVFHVAQNDKVALPHIDKVVIPLNGESIAGYVAKQRKIVSVADAYALPSDSPFRFSPEIDRRLGYKTISMLCAPLCTRDGGLIGVLQLLNCIEPGDERKVIPFAEEGERMIRLLSVQAAMLIDNARMYHALNLERLSLEEMVQERTEELENAYFALKEKDALLRKDLQRAHKMQRNILPQPKSIERMLEGTGLHLFSRFIPCDELGGDFWDMLKRSDGTLLFGVFDFAGHGVSAALNTFQMKSLFHQFENKESSPGEIVHFLNHQLFHRFSDYATGVIFCYDPETSRLQLCRGGHPYPLLYRCRSGEVEVLSPFGTGIGLFAQGDTETTELYLEKGDKLLIVTDGLYEVHHHKTEEEFGFKRLTSLFAGCASLSAEEVYHAIMNAVKAFAQTDAFHDDLFFLLLEKK